MVVGKHDEEYTAQIYANPQDSLLKIYETMKY